MLLLSYYPFFADVKILPDSIIAVVSLLPFNNYKIDIVDMFDITIY